MDQQQFPAIRKSDGGKDIVSAREMHTSLGASERFSNWFDRQLSYGFEEGVDFVGCKVFNALANQELDDYVITLDMAKEIAMIQRSDKGKAIRQYFIEQEKKLRQLSLANIPDFSNPALAARAWADEFERRQLAEKKIEEDAPKVAAAEALLECENSVTVQKFAKAVGSGEIKMFRWLRQQKFLMDTGSSYNLPFQKYIEMGLFEVGEKAIPMGQNKPKIHMQPFITPKGQIYLANKFQQFNQK